MAVYGVAQGPDEAFALYGLTPRVLADREVCAAGSEQEFHHRVARWVARERPGSSDGMVRHLAATAWRQHVGRRVRLEITPQELSLLLDHLDTLPAGPAAERLRDGVAGAAARLGWSGPHEHEDDDAAGVGDTEER